MISKCDTHVGSGHKARDDLVEEIVIQLQADTEIFEKRDTTILFKIMTQYKSPSDLARLLSRITFDRLDQPGPGVTLTISGIMTNNDDTSKNICNCLLSISLTQIILIIKCTLGLMIYLRSNKLGCEENL